MQPHQAFLIAPFDPQGGAIQEAVQDALQKAGFSIAPYPEWIDPGAQRVLSIFDSIRHADLIVADVSSHDPNVLFELGFAEASRKPTILLFNLQSGSRITSDLAGLDYVAYDPSDFSDLADRLGAVTKTFRLPRSA
jgi:nucleoside 2-deoxyribosyltransferase